MLKKQYEPTELERLNRNRNWENGRLRGLIGYLNIITDPECYNQVCEAVHKQIKINNDNFEKQRKEIQK